MNILTIDLGNTDLTMCLFVDAEKQKIYREPIINLTEESLTFLLVKLVKDKKVDAVGISCVVPRLKELVISVAKEFTELCFVVDANLVPNFKINAKDKKEVGADFIAVYYGCLDKYNAPLIVYDLGSASKSMLINNAGVVEGVTIKSGIDKSYNHLIKDIPHLPKVELKLSVDPLGHDTISAIAAGTLNGELGWIINSSKAIEKYYDLNATKILTGGCSRHFKDAIKGFIYEPDIILQGIYKIVVGQINA